MGKRVLIKENGCWEWISGKRKSNYPMTILCIDGCQHRIYVTRLMYFIFNGRFDKRKVIRHSCDNPGCINPDHLILGTQKDNCIDRHLRHRIKNQFTVEEVLEIRKLSSEGKSVSQIQKIYGRCWQTISNIVKRRSWTFV